MASVQDSAQISTQVLMRNVTSSRMTLTRSNSWVGVPIGGTFPGSVSASGTRFDHSMGTDRSKAAVVYSGLNAAGEACSWVLAWDAPAVTDATNPNKVFMACGLATEIAKLSFATILSRLDKNGAAEVSPTEPTSKTGGHGSIQFVIPNTAFLGADFSLC